jgi:hypothetical protein
MKHCGTILLLLALFGCDDEAAKADALEECGAQCGAMWTQALEACPAREGATDKEGKACVEKAQSTKLECINACTGKK